MAPGDLSRVRDGAASRSRHRRHCRMGPRPGLPAVVTPHPHWSLCRCRRCEAPNPQWTLNGEAICNTDVLTGERVEAEVRNLMAIQVSLFMQAQEWSGLAAHLAQVHHTSFHRWLGMLMLQIVCIVFDLVP